MVGPRGGACMHGSEGDTPSRAPAPLDLELVQRLRVLLRRGIARVVLSSAWRTDRQAVEFLIETCRLAGIPQRCFLGQTLQKRGGRSLSAAGRRLFEISQWLALYRVQYGVERWVALDDLPLAGSCRDDPDDFRANHLVRTSPAFGLQAADVDRALQILTGSTAPLARRLGDPRSDKTLVLDIDGTLIDSMHRSEVVARLGPGVRPVAEDDDGDCLFPRPHLEAFLNFCFARFAAVAIWTAASRGWADFVIRGALGAARPWAFVWSGEHCISKQVCCGGFETKRVSVKPLRKVWRSTARRRLGFDRHRTVIVEDTPAGCMQNFGNAIFVPTYQVASAWSCESGQALESTLEKLIPYLQAEVLQNPDVRRRFPRAPVAGDVANVEEVCAVCDGTGRLLEEACPLCSP